jgi:hypothetical protein
VYIFCSFPKDGSLEPVGRRELVVKPKVKELNHAIFIVVVKYIRVLKLT